MDNLILICNINLYFDIKQILQVSAMMTQFFFKSDEKKTTKSKPKTESKVKIHCYEIKQLYRNMYYHLSPNPLLINL